MANALTSACRNAVVAKPRHSDTAQRSYCTVLRSTHAAPLSYAHRSSSTAQTWLELTLLQHQRGKSNAFPAPTWYYQPLHCMNMASALLFVSLLKS